MTQRHEARAPTSIHLDLVGRCVVHMSLHRSWGSSGRQPCTSSVQPKVVKRGSVRRKTFPPAFPRRSLFCAQVVHEQGHGMGHGSSTSSASTPSGSVNAFDKIMIEIVTCYYSLASEACRGCKWEALTRNSRNRGWLRKFPI